MEVEQFLESFSLNQPGDLLDSNPRRTIVDSISLDGAWVKRFTNEFWTAGQRKSNSLHEISYRGCFKAELPQLFISLLSQPGDWVYDPFMGRGTTLVEAALLGRRPAGNDINPLSQALTAPRLKPPTLREINARLKQVPWNDTLKADIDLSMFYSPATEGRIVSLRNYLADRKAGQEEEDVDRWIRMTATNRLTGHSPGFFSVYTLPPNQAVSPEAQIKINEKRNQTPPDRDVAAIILKKSKSLLSDLTDASRRQLRTVADQARLYCGPSEKASPIEAESVSLVVTSPPFLDVVQYEKDNWLRCWFNGFDAGVIGKSITMSKTVDGWRKTMAAVLMELARVLRSGGWFAFEVGEVKGGKVRLDEIVAPLGEAAGLACRGIVINQQVFTKTANCWGVNNNTKGTNTNRVVLFHKRESNGQATIRD